MSSKLLGVMSRSGLIACDTLRLKLAGAFFNLCGITSHSHSIPLVVLTAVSDVSLGRIKIW